MVIGALKSYTSDILDMVEEGNKVCGKLRYHGYHHGEFLGYPPTGRHVWWYGTPLFTFDGTKVRDLWVLGDVHGLTGRLSNEAGSLLDGGYDLRRASRSLAIIPCPLLGVKRTWLLHCKCPLMTQSGHRPRADATLLDQVDAHRSNHA